MKNLKSLLPKQFTRKLAPVIYSTYSRKVDEFNWSALLYQWTRDQGHIPVFNHRFDLYRHVNEDILKSIPVDYLEFGVYRGESIRKWLELNPNEGSRFYGFDSFEGLPEDGAAGLKSESGWKKGDFDIQGEIPEFNDTRVQFIKGWFQHTLPSFLEQFEPRNRVVVHIDCDLYTSTLFCLTQLNRILTPGSVLIFDEFYASLHEFRAFINYTESYLRTYSVLGGVPGGMFDKFTQIAMRLND
ncbi:MAG: TylF/MycF/NovP-related O-methyltransferase [bacterium]